MKTKKNILSILILTILIISGLLYPLVFADDTCKYHKNHDELCGYVEAVSEQPCTHEHDENCYNKILVCNKEEHIHNKECFQEVRTLICDHVSEEEHTEECYTTEEKIICSKEEHTHTADCLKEELACTHEHDETCGYVEAVAGHDCTHLCSNCNKELVRKATLSFNADSNIQIESELTGQEGEDSVYFYLKMNKGLLDYIDLEEENGVYSVECKDNTRLELQPVYFSNDTDNVYLKYEQNYNVTVEFEIPISIPKDMINKKLSLTTASSYNETEQEELSSIMIDENNIASTTTVLDDSGESTQTSITLSLVKSSEIGEDKLAQLTWKVEIIAGSDGILLGTIYTNSLGDGYNAPSNQYMYKSQLTKLLNCDDYNFTFYDTNNTSYTYENLSENTKVYKFDITAKTNISDGSKTVIEYNSWADMSNVVYNETFRNTIVKNGQWITSASVELKFDKIPAGKYGNYKLSYNEIKDAFIKDAQYSAYYNENSPLGTAGSFHLVGFGTVTLNTHTNGNVLANNLIAGSNFGTNRYAYELSYARNYNKINSTSASSTNDHILVVGSENELTLGENKDVININVTKIDKPYEIVQDVDSTNNPFIDLDRVKTEIRGISNRLKNITADKNIDASDITHPPKIVLSKPDDVLYCNLVPDDLKDLKDNTINLKGFSKGHNGTIVINVDCNGNSNINLPVARVYVDDELISTSETVEFSAGKVIWNFYNCEGATINTNIMTGMVIALGANVNINQNLNGTVVAENINVNAESHRTDFTGDIEAPEETEGASIIVRKVDRDNISTYLPKASFELYKYNGTDYELDTTHSSLISNSSGRLLIDNLVYNTAYRLVETTAPEGYILKDTPYEFILSNSDTSTYPVSTPSDFTGESYNSGKVIYFKNEKSDPAVTTVSIEIDKQWYDINNNPITKESGEISVILNQNVYTDEAMTTSVTSKKYGTYSIMAPAWKMTIMNLPKMGVESIEGQETEVYYSYSVKEIGVENYTTTYENNNIVSGTITVKNTSTLKDFILPETGGSGILPYLISGLVMMGLGLIIYKKSTNRKVGEYQ